MLKDNEKKQISDLFEKEEEEKKNKKSKNKNKKNDYFYILIVNFKEKDNNENTFNWEISKKKKHITKFLKLVIFY